MTFSSNGAAAASPLLVRLEGVNVTLQGAAALKNIYLDIRQGGHLALLGPNGAGKSTLLRVLRGETRPDQRQGGSVRWFPPDCRPDCDPYGDDAPLAGRGMTSLISPGLQEHYMRQAWNIRGEELVIAGLYDDYLLYRDPTEEQRAQCFALAEKLQTAALLEKSVGTLSQGQLRVLLLMRALIRRPCLLLLDEATDGLDAPTRCMFVILLESLVNQPDSPTIVMTTHRPQLPDFLKQAARMENGELSGPSPLPPAGDEKNEYLSSVSTTNKIPGFAVNPASCVAEQKARQETRQTTKREAEPDRNSAAPQTDREGAYVLLRNATVFVDRAEVLHELDWEILPGEQWTVLGGNGAGKTTLLRVLMGEEPVAVGGDISRNLPRHGGLNPDLSHIQRGIRLVSDRLQALYTYNENASDVVFSGMDGSVGVYREAEDAERAEALRCLRLVGMEAWSERPFRSLSTGQARRVLLARALAGNPEMLLLDEPFSGLDRESRATMTEILESRIADGLQTVLVSHHEEDILPSCTHLARLDNGRLISAMPLPKP